MNKIYSLSSYWIEENRDGKSITLVNIKGNRAEASLDALKEAFISGDDFSREETINKTNLNNLILATKSTCMTINYNKVDKKKSPKDYKAELAIQAEEVQKALLATGMSGVIEILKNPVLLNTPGENRTIRGYHISSTLDSNGYLAFTDMEAKDKSGMFMPKQANIRAVRWAIINDVKYIVK